MKAALGSITTEGLVWLRDLENVDGFDHMTCRPIQKRSKTELEVIYQSALEDKDKEIRGLWVSEDVRPIGKLTAIDWNPRNRSMEVGYFLRREYRRRGLMREGLLAFCGLLFQARNCNKITAQTGAFNDPSIKLLESCGFQRDGILRQHHEYNGILMDDYLYSILAEEYRKKHMEQGK